MRCVQQLKGFRAQGGGYHDAVAGQVGIADRRGRGAVEGQVGEEERAVVFEGSANETKRENLNSRVMEVRMMSLCSLMMIGFFPRKR